MYFHLQELYDKKLVIDKKRPERATKIKYMEEKLANYDQYAWMAKAYKKKNTNLEEGIRLICKENDVLEFDNSNMKESLQKYEDYVAKLRGNNGGRWPNDI